MLESEIDLWGKFNLHAAAEPLKRLVPHSGNVLLVHHDCNMWQNLLNGLSVRSPHVGSSMCNLVRIFKAAQKFNDLCLVTVLQHSDDSVVTNVGAVYVVNGVRIVGFDNERGKGDHCHLDGKELPFAFTGVDQLIEDFIAAVAARREP